MTIPSERTRAVQNVEVFLLKLCDPKLTPRIPRSIRREAAWLLNHYPGQLDLIIAAKRSPEYWGVPLTRSGWDRLMEMRKKNEEVKPKKRRAKR